MKCDINQQKIQLEKNKCLSYTNKHIYTFDIRLYIN